MRPTDVSCIPIEEIGELERWGDDDPRRRHYSGCARCQARFRSYLAFVDPDPAPPGADVAAARVRLGEWIERTIERSGGTPAASPAARPHASAPDGRAVRAVRPTRRLRWAWALVPVLGAAAAIVILTLAPGDQGEEGPRRWRGGMRPPSAAPVLEVRAEAGGGLALAWDPVEGATRYEVVLLDRAGREVRRLSVPASTSRPWSIPAKEWQSLLRSGVARVELVAWRDRAELSRSRPQEIPEP
jgi:hypothetical protein